MSQHALGQYLPQLYALLVKAVQVPHKALEHDLIFKMGQECAQSLGIQPVADDDAGGTSALKVLVLVLH